MTSSAFKSTWPATGPATWSATGRPVYDGGGEPVLSVSVSNGQPFPATEGGVGIDFRISASGPLTGNVTGQWLTVDGSAIGGNPGDFTKVPLTAFTILQAVGFVDVTVPLSAADAVWKPDRSFSVQISNLEGPDNPVIGRGAATGVITDSLPAPTVAIADGTPDPVNRPPGGTHTFRIQLTGATTGNAVEVDWTTEDGTATKGQDYEAAQGTANIPAGQSFVDVSVTVLP